MPAGEAGEHFAESGGYAGSGNFNQGGGGFQSGGGLDQGYPGYSIYGSAGQERGWNMGGGTYNDKSASSGGLTPFQQMQIAMRRPPVAPRRVVNPTTGQITYLDQYGYQTFPPGPGFDPLSGIRAPSWINDPGGMFSYPKNNEGMQNWGGGGITGVGGTSDSGFEKDPSRIGPEGINGASMSPMGLMSAVSALNGAGGPQVNPGPQQPQTLQDWMAAMQAWRSGRPDRPGAGFGGDLAARQAFQQQMMDWRNLRPDRPAGVGWGQSRVAQPMRTPPIMAPQPSRQPRPQPRPQYERPAVRPLEPRPLKTAPVTRMPPTPAPSRQPANRGPRRLSADVLRRRRVT